jgi:hypothetical protein
MGFLKIMLLATSCLFSSANYNVVKMYEFESVIIEYGSLSVDNHIDGYIIIYDRETNDLIDEVTYDSGGYDLFKYLAIVDVDTFIIVCDTYYFNLDYKYPIYRNSILLKYNISGELLFENSIDYKPDYYHNHNNLLILTNNEEEIIYNKDFDILENIQISNEVIGSFGYQYQGEAMVNGISVEEILIDYPGIYDIEIHDDIYNFSFKVTVHPDIQIIGAEYSDGYLGTVTIYGFGELYLNDVKYNIGTEIYQVGNYDLAIIGLNNYYSSLSFTILPNIVYSGESNQGQLVEEQEFYETIQIFSDAQSMFLNGEIYSSDFIDSPGQYSLIVYGINGFEARISFLLLPMVKGVENGKTYNEVNLKLFGEAFLNGQKISGDYKLDKEGEYILELLLDDEVYQTIEFTVESSREEISNNKIDLFGYLKYIFLIIALVGGVVILRKK